MDLAGAASPALSSRSVLKTSSSSPTSASSCRAHRLSRARWLRLGAVEVEFALGTECRLEVCVTRPCLGLLVIAAASAMAGALPMSAILLSRDGVLNTEMAGGGLFAQQKALQFPFCKCLSCVSSEEIWMEMRTCVASSLRCCSFRCFVVLSLTYALIYCCLPRPE